MASQEEDRIYRIPKNVIQSQRFMGFGKRNWLDAIVLTLLLIFLIGLIPFVTKVRIIVTASIAAAVILLCLLGIKGMSISECVINIFISLPTKHQYHLRSIRYVSRKNSKSVTAPRVINESIAEKAVRLTKEFVTSKREKS